MTGRLSSEEQRTLDMNRVGDVLGSVFNDPDADLEKLADDLDAALTPGNTRKPIEIEPEAISQPRSVERDVHSAIGDAEVDGGSDEYDASDDMYPSAPQEPLFPAAIAYEDEPIAPPAPSPFVTQPHIAPSDRVAALLAQRAQESAGLTLPGDGEPEDVATTTEGGQLRMPQVDAQLADPEMVDLEPDFDAPEVRLADAPVAQPAPATTSAPTPLLTATDTHDDSPDEASPTVPLRAKPEGKVAETVAGAKAWLAAQPRGKRLLICALPVLIVLTLLFKACTSPADSPAGMASAPTSTAPVVQDVTPGGGVENGVLLPATVAAVCPDGSTSPNFAFTKDNSEAWVCMRSLGIDGTVLEMTFKKPIVVTEVMIVPGFAYVEPSGLDRWTEHRVVSRALWNFGTSEMLQNINPTRTGATLTVPSIATQRISVTIMETVEPAGASSSSGSILDSPSKRTKDAFAISNIQIIGHEA